MLMRFCLLSRKGACLLQAICAISMILKKGFKALPANLPGFFLVASEKISRSKIFNRVFMYEGQGAADMAPE